MKQVCKINEEDTAKLKEHEHENELKIEQTRKDIIETLNKVIDLDLLIKYKNTIEKDTCVKVNK